MESFRSVLLIATICIWVVWALLVIINVIDWINDNILCNSGNRYTSIVPNTKLIQETINYTRPILVKNGIKKFPIYKVYYYKHKKYLGLFNGGIVIYLKSNNDIPMLVDTTLHEIMHYIQSQSNKKFNLYEEYTRTYGYYRNPFEVESRQFAAEHTPGCLEYLVSRNLIIKH